MHRSLPSSHTAAFSLLEMAVVLTIVGLIAGGIFAGFSIVHSSSLRNSIADIQRYTTAVGQFQMEFKALPGDMPNATDYWGSAGGNKHDNTCALVDSTTLPDPRATCDGDGDGIIDGSHWYNPTYNVTSRYEIYRAWQHLANAKLIQGSFTGVVGPNDLERASVPGINTPAGKLANSGFDFWYVGAITDPSWGNLFVGPYGNMLLFGQTSGDTDEAIYPVLTPTEALRVDQKIDDGKPATGMVVVPKIGSWTGINCTTTNDATTAAYAVSITDPACSLLTRLDN